MNSVSILRAVANRLTKAGQDLPHQVGYLASTLANCQDALQSSAFNADTAVVVHKLKTRTSALLQDRTPTGRLCGIVIAKALVEAGGHAFLSESGSWVRNLIQCLNRPDTPEVKQMCVNTLTRIYLMTADDQQLVREITTPTLPAFMTACLSNIKPATTEINGTTVTHLSPLLQVVLRSWYHLIQHFASTIRPHAASIKTICLSLIGDCTCKATVQRAAEDVLARLHYCASRNTAASEWSQMCSQAIEASHDTADLVFRAIVEDWTPNTTRISKVTKKQKSESTPGIDVPDVLGLTSWTGISEGCQRLAALISLIKTLSTSPHSHQIEIPLGSIFDLTSRLADLLLPTRKFALRNNNEITRDEREELWLNVPRIHVQVLSLFHALMSTFRKALYPVNSILSQQMLNIFDAEHANATVRGHTYRLMKELLQQNGLHITKSKSSDFRQLASCCCNDLLPQVSIAAGQGQEKGSSVPKNTITRLTLDKGGTKVASSSEAGTAIYIAAYSLLPILISHTSWHKLVGGQSVRARLDSTAIFLQHHEAILASVLNPPRASSSSASTTPSLLPFLARDANDVEFSSRTSLEQLGYEALMRPRLPAIGAKTDLDVHDPVEQDESMDDDEEMNGLDNPAESQEVPEAEQLEPGSHHREADKHANDKSKDDVYGSQKRDFTSLLEESADAQLAASADTKRQKTELGANFEPDFQPATELEPAPGLEETSSTMPIAIAASETPLVSEHTASISAVNEADDSSDDSIPPIDATLNTFSDSEDEDGGSEQDL